MAIIWENKEIMLITADNPAIPLSEGFHMIVLQKKNIASAWAEPEFYSRMSFVAAYACKIMKKLGLAPWFNIQANGNIGAAMGNPKLYIHIFARHKKGKTWGAPVDLPAGPGPYGFKPIEISEEHQLIIKDSLNNALNI